MFIFIKKIIVYIIVMIAVLSYDIFLSKSNTKTILIYKNSNNPCIVIEKGFELEKNIRKSDSLLNIRNSNVNKKDTIRTNINIEIGESIIF